MPPHIDKILAGKLLLQSIGLKDREGDRDTETRAEFDYNERHIKNATIYRQKGTVTPLEKLAKLIEKYWDHYGADWIDKLAEDSLASLKNESKEWRTEVLYWCRKVANADWEFESALGNISKTEMDELQRYHKELGFVGRGTTKAIGVYQCPHQ